MPLNDLDKSLFATFEKLPVEEVHPSTRAEVMDRISRFHEEKAGIRPLSTWFLRISGGVLAASLTALLGLAPLLVENARNLGRIEEARMEVKEEVYMTNQMRQYFQNARPDYTSVQYVNY